MGNNHINRFNRLKSYQHKSMSIHFFFYRHKSMSIHTQFNLNYLLKRCLYITFFYKAFSKRCFTLNFFFFKRGKKKKKKKVLQTFNLFFSKEHVNFPVFFSLLPLSASHLSYLKNKLFKAPNLY